MATFLYTTEHTDLLAKRDEKLGAFIAEYGHIERDISDDVFSGLIYNIVNQQLSMKACDTLWSKLISALGEISPDNCTDSAKLKEIGLSRSKADCISALSQLFLNGTLTADSLKEMSDNEVIRNLTAIKGIGRWTAEMTLIFCLGRIDVLSLSDFGIRKGLSLLHDIDIKNIREMERFCTLYSPVGTVASLYLWEAARIL